MGEKQREKERGYVSHPTSIATAWTLKVTSSKKRIQNAECWKVNRTPLKKQHQFKV